VSSNCISAEFPREKNGVAHAMGSHMQCGRTCIVFAHAMWSHMQCGRTCKMYTTMYKIVSFLALATEDSHICESESVDVEHKLLIYNIH
jgi:hypothetical protein